MSIFYSSSRLFLFPPRERKTYTEHGKKYPHHIPPPLKVHVGYLCVCVRLWPLPPSLLPPYIISGMHIQCVYVHVLIWTYIPCLHACVYMERKHKGASHSPSQVTHKYTHIHLYIRLFRYLFMCLYFLSFSFSVSLPLLSFSKKYKNS